MNHEEHRLQTACVRYFRLQYSALSLCLFAIPNGERRDKLTGARLKAEGVTAGVADLFLSIPNQFHHGLYIEMKTEKGRQSPPQKAFEEAVTSRGYKYAICRSLGEFMLLITSYLNLTKL